MSAPYDRPTSEPGGMQCVECDVIFVGAEHHARCAICEDKHVAVMSEREACAQAIATANLRVGGIETPLMRGDNLAITLCTHFDDGEPNEDDTGWSPAATAGYEQVIEAIREHYAVAIRKRSEP